MSTDLAILAPLPCETCEGSGEIQYFVSIHVNSNGVIEPVYLIVSCDDCDGTGEQTCRLCEARAAVTLYDGVPACAGCAEEEA